jgi:topoisomerase (DNA) II binding protein 1
MDRYKIQPLKGCNVCLTGYTDRRFRDSISKKVEENGGKYYADLIEGKCTHLLAKEPKGPKYEHAVQWKSVKIVSAKWLTDCIQAQEKVDETPYLVLERSAHEAPAPVKWVPPPLEEDDTPWDSHYLFGCRIFMVGFDSHETETDPELKVRAQKYAFEQVKRVRAGAGITTNDFNKATHIVIGKYCTPQHLYDVRSVKDRCVKGDWLIKCEDERQLLPLEDFLIEESLWSKMKASNTVQRNNSAVLSGGNATISSDDHVDGDASNRQGRTSRLNPEAANIQNKMRSPPKLMSRAQNPLTRENLSRANVPETYGTELLPTEPITNDKQGESCEPAAINTPFVDVRIALSALLCEEEAVTARDIVSQGGGRVIDSRVGKDFMSAGFMVCPSTPSAKERRTLASMQIGNMQFVTCAWLEECLEQGSIISVKDSLIYEPMPCDVPIPGMNEFCISTSQYNEKTKREIKMMCVLNEATYSDKLRRSKNTHLLTPIPSGKKYEGAMEWGMKVTTKEWLEECIRAGKCLSESGFVPKDDNMAATPTATVPTEPIPQPEPTQSADVQARKSIAQQIVGRDLSSLLQTSSPGPANQPLTTPKGVTGRSPVVDGKYNRSVGSRGKTPLSRTSSGVTPASKRAKSSARRSRGDEDGIGGLLNDVVSGMDVDEHDAGPQDMPLPDPDSPKGTENTVAQGKRTRGKTQLGMSSLRMTQMENHETQVGWNAGEIKAGSPSPRCNARPDGTDKLNTLFAANRTAQTSPSQRGIHAEEWM